MQLILSRGARKSVQIEKRNAGDLISRISSLFTDTSHFSKAARQLSVDKSFLLRCVDEFQKGVEETKTVELPETNTAVSRISIRGRFQSLSESRDYPTFQAALDAQLTCVEPIIFWDDDSQLCAVDLDFHGIDGERDLRRLLAYVQPEPAYAWVTHGKGYRLIYTNGAGYTARELAAVSALSISRIEPLAKLELKTDTRHPKYSNEKGQTCSDVWVSKCSSVDTKALATWIGRKSVDSEEIEEWLTEHGLTIGNRYDHDRCPVCPNEPANRQPVCPKERGIMCYACAGRGVMQGSRTAGWFSYEALIGRVVATNLRLCLKNLTHWEHAKYVLHENLPYGEDITKAVYSAALKLMHGDDPRIARVFTAGKNFIRFDNRWSTASGQTLTKDCDPILATLPACQYLNDEGEIKASAERVCRFSQATDLSDYGYPSLTPIWGARIYSHRLTIQDETKIPVVLHTKLLKPEAVAGQRPKYVPASQRMPLEDAWKLMEELFPGINRDYVNLLLAAKGITEGEAGMPPLIFVTGATGSGKTQTIKIAAAIAGDSVHAVQWTNNVERLRQAIIGAKEEGNFVAFDEVLKSGRGNGRSPAQAMEFLLNLTPETLTHKLYTGPVHLGALPVIVLTDTKLPAEVAQHAQLARRIMFVSLPRRVHWEASLRKADLSGFEQLRVANPDYAEACDAILSNVIDTYFTSQPNFQDIGESLGFQRLERTVDARDKDDLLQRFFVAVCLSEDCSGTDAKRWKGKGWKVIDRVMHTNLADAWRDVCDEDFTESEKCHETDWGGLLGVPDIINFEIKKHGGSKVAVRFVVYGKSRLDYRVNKDIFNGVLPDELDSGKSGDCVHRPRDTELNES